MREHIYCTNWKIRCCSCGRQKLETREFRPQLNIAPCPSIIIDTCLVSPTVTLKILILCYYYMSLKPSRPGLQTQSYCFALKSRAEDERSIQIYLVFFIYFMFTFLEISQVSSVYELRFISAASRSESFLLLLLLFFCNILSVGTFFQFFNNVSGMTQR